MNRNIPVDIIAKPIRKSLTKRVEFNSYIRELSTLEKYKHPNVAHIYGIVHEGELESTAKLAILHCSLCKFCAFSKTDRDEIFPTWKSKDVFKCELIINCIHYYNFLSVYINLLQ